MHPGRSNYPKSQIHEKAPILESVDKVLHVYQQLKIIKDHQYASVLAATNVDTAQLELR